MTITDQSFSGASKSADRGSDLRPSVARPGLTLVEVVFSTLIVGVMTVAALNTLGAATESGRTTGNRAIAYGLADDRLAQVLAASYGGLDVFDGSVTSVDGFTCEVDIQRLQPANLQPTPGSADQGVKRVEVTVEADGEQLVQLFAIVTDTE